MTTTNFTKFFVGAGVLALTVTSCSNDIDLIPDNVPGTGRSAFMTVTLHDANRGTRAGEDEFPPEGSLTLPDDFEGDYADGHISEYTINNARFFFFAENGAYICESSVWSGSHAPSDEERPNVTLEGKTVVVLENLTTRDNPAYMITVLNGDGFTPAATMEATAQSLVQYSNNNAFVMSTSSYVHDLAKEDPNHDNTYYYATKLTDANFAEGTPEMKGEEVNTDGLTPVDVYVERLAGKVELKYNSLSNEVITVGNRTLYKINATVAGNNNDNNEGETPNEGVTQLYVEILGWGLNGTNHYSYLSKQFEPAWANGTSNPFQNWNNAGYHRSFWALSQILGDETKVDGKNKLDYITWSDIKNNAVNYANEYAADPAFYSIGGEVVASQLTHVILKTNICNEKGEVLDLVRGANGVLYGKKSYLKYILNNANIQKSLNAWYLTDKTGLEEVSRETVGDFTKITYTSTAKFAQVNEDMVKLASSGTGTGMVKVVAGLEGLTDNNEQPYVWAVKNEDGTFTTISEADATANLNNILAGVTGNSDKSGAMAYTGGANFYVIPIEHNTAVGMNADGEYNLGYYGFIRNHWYQITLNKIEKIGFGVFQPAKGEAGEEEEELIPNKPENPAFYVTANLKVLAWKIVNQSVDL